MHALRASRLPIRIVLGLSGLLRRPSSRPSSVLDQLFVQLLADFSRDRRRAIEEFFQSLATDQDLLAQITPVGTDIFNASTQDRPGVRYGCVITRAQPPGLRSMWGAGLNGYGQATHALYVALSRIASETALGRKPSLTREQAAALKRAYRSPLDLRANDGIVPTLSQIWGDVVAAVWADHHDVIGHFHGPTHVPPHFDWVASRSGFDRAQFEALWRQVAVYVAAEAWPG